MNAIPSQVRTSGRLLAALSAAAAVSALLTIPAAPAGAAACRHVTGPFHTNHDVVTGAGGARYIPYGINVVGLAHPLTTSQRATRAAMAGTVDSDDAVIDAAAGSWCANTVRLQVAQDYLVNPDGSINKTFLAAVEAEVAHARADGLVVVLNCQTQTGGHHLQEFMPTARTYSFWDSLAYHYKGDPGVVFDLLNEPSYISGWAEWRNGGAEHGVTFHGMQSLADRIRRHDGAHNLLWVEGPHTGGSLRYAWQYRITGDGPLEYSEHRPRGPHTSARWWLLFGYLAARHLAPVVAGEEADYARTDANWACWDNAPRSYPRFLSYLGNHGIGGIFTEMTEGQLIESANLADPTHFRANWSCTTGLDEGAGNQILKWMTAHNS